MKKRLFEAAYKAAWAVDHKLARLCDLVEKTPLYKPVLALRWWWGEHVSWQLNIRRMTSENCEPDII